MLSRIKLAWWWYVTIEQYPYHPNKYQQFSTLTEKHNRAILAHELHNGKSIFCFTSDQLSLAGF
jgi:hypothetical protein